LEESVEIVAVCDPDADALAQMASTLPRRPRFFRSEVDLLAAGGIDAIVICTPHANHATQVRNALEAGVHVLCEKPFVTQYDEGAELVLKAREKNLALFVAYTRRSRGHARFLLQAAKEVAPLTRVLINRSQPWLQTHRRTWRVHEGEGGGFLIDAGASMLDILLQIMDAPVEEVDAVLERQGGVEVDIRGSIRIVFQGGAQADINLMGDATESIEAIQIFGEEGTAGWFLREDAPFHLYKRHGGGPSEEGDPVPYRTAPPDSAFIAALREGRNFGAEAASNIHDAANAVPVIALFEQILREAKWR
jgi:predicted dehydrogenase